MPLYDFVQVDAFTHIPLEGNACAVFADASGLDDRAMQRIAREMNLSETAYVFASDHAHFGVRYFTPASEIPMAGHPTVATVHALRELGRLGNRTSVTLHMPAGIVPVEVTHSGERTRYTMRQLPPTFGRCLSRVDCAAALGLLTEDLLPDIEPQVVSTGTPQLMIALATREALDRTRPRLDSLFPKDRDYFSVHVFARDDRDATLVARHFAAFPDILEDPFTGSATGGMAAYCAQHGIVRQMAYEVVQGEHVGRPGRGYVTVRRTGAAIDFVEVGGEAVTVIRGTLTF